MNSFGDPYSLFGVKGRVALITGATGAFGTVAAKTLADAGCNLVLAAGNTDALAEIETACKDLAADVVTINSRPDTEAACQAMVDTAVAAHGRLDIWWLPRE